MTYMPYEVTEPYVTIYVFDANYRIIYQSKTSVSIIQIIFKSAPVTHMTTLPYEVNEPYEVDILMLLKGIEVRWICLDSSKAD